MKRIEELYDVYSKKIFNYFYFLTYDTLLSEELTQETFYQAIISIGKYKEKSRISTWLYAIARNTYLKNLRVMGKNRTEQVECIDIQSPEDVMIRKDRINAIRECISKLPEKYKTVLVLRDREGLSYYEISSITGISVSNVKVTIHRARNRFKEEFKRYEGDEAK